MKNSGYSSSEILSMQKDAIQRVREMQRRANNHINHEEPPSAPPPPPQKATMTEATKSKPMNILSSLNLNDDKAIVLIIILILLNEGADTSLILALLYLII